MKVIHLGGNERKNQNKDLNKLEARFCMHKGSRK